MTSGVDGGLGVGTRGGGGGDGAVLLSLDVYDVQGLFSKAQTTAVRLMEELAHRAVLVVVAQACELSFGPVSDKGL
jgi:hypothetical protein